MTTHLNETDTNRRNRLNHAAQRYANADKSDPFTLARARTHIANGIVSYSASGEEALYDATLVPVMRHLPAGQTFSDGSTSWHAWEYSNMVRP